MSSTTHFAPLRSSLRSLGYSPLRTRIHIPTGTRRAMSASGTKESASGSEKKHFYAPSTTPSGQAPQFASTALSRPDLLADPFDQFQQWYHAAEAAVTTPYTVCLATAALPSGSVSARFVYLKEVDAKGFVVYSNVGTSRKAADLATNPHASLAFWWEPLERQVRVEGVVERLTQAESQTYFDTRARGSRIGAWASRQSAVLQPAREAAEAQGAAANDDGRAQLQSWVAEQEERFADTETIPCPPFWGGLRVVPSRIEFWQGRESRLHDRFVYVREEPEGDGKEWTWKIERLSP